MSTAGSILRSCAYASALLTIASRFSRARDIAATVWSYTSMDTRAPWELYERSYGCSGQYPAGVDWDGETVYDPEGERKVLSSGRVNWWGRSVDWEDRLGFRGPDDVESAGPAWTRLEAVADSLGGESYLAGVLVDITERKQAEAAHRPVADVTKQQRPGLLAGHRAHHEDRGHPHANELAEPPPVSDFRAERHSHCAQRGEEEDVRRDPRCLMLDHSSERVLAMFRAKDGRRFVARQGGFSCRVHIRL